MRIIVDAMGGDHAPDEIIKGAIRAQKELGVEIVLVGREDEVQACLAANAAPSIEVVNATEVITMEDDPSTATRRKKDSSMTVGLTMLKDGKGDAFVSAGSTGALLTGATLIVKRIRGIRRAAMAPVLPVTDRGVLLIDCGATAECTAEYLLQFAMMGSFYAQRILNIAKPRVGLVNMGTEDGKGDDLRHEVFPLLKKAGEEGRINFVGNVEGTGIFNDACDVAVCDGFTGNVLLKTTEGAIKCLMKNLKQIFYKNTVNKLAALVIKKDLGGLKKRMDVNEIGGTAMIGISKPVIKAHGSSNAAAIFAAIRQAKTVVESGITDEIKANVEFMKVGTEEA